MSESISVQLVNGEDKSASLHSWWGGTDMGDEEIEGGKGRPALIRVMEGYYEELMGRILKRKNSRVQEPMDRLEPDAVMVSFVRYLGTTIGGNRNDPWDFSDDLRLTDTPSFNSVYGHWEFDLKTGKARRMKQ